MSQRAGRESKGKRGEGREGAMGAEGAEGAMGAAEGAEGAMGAAEGAEGAMGLRLYCFTAENSPSQLPPPRVPVHRPGLAGGSPRWVSLMMSARPLMVKMENEVSRLSR